MRRHRVAVCDHEWQVGVDVAAEPVIGMIVCVKCWHLLQCPDRMVDCAYCKGACGQCGDDVPFDCGHDLKARHRRPFDAEMAAELTEICEALPEPCDHEHPVEITDDDRVVCSGCGVEMTEDEEHL